MSETRAVYQPARTGTTKYGNRRTEVDGITFHSAKEAARYKDLRLLEAGKVISGLELQRSFALVVNGKHVCTYIADFCYFENGKYVVEDVKSPASKTPVYMLKKKLMAATRDIEIRET